ncbi:hypothetical protein [Chroococcidiopsis sp. CCMEE 29]|uniref:hypothetical protein n=1 Tax=Chroococcidiopsis sp. CCMEE 29 TaxID=155894 RepID=UPI00202270F8|nr:hypothetical protein [Chroococcidiopsis sp. CCMEE 29]
MDCQFSSLPYTIKTGNILDIIAQQGLASDSRWTEIMKPDDTSFIQEAKRLQEGQKSPPLPGTGLSKGSFLDLLEALGVSASGLPKGDLNQYQVENVLGFIGKYQFGESLLIDLGYYKATIYYGHGATKNYWQGIWTRKNGIDSKSKFLHSPDIQEEAIREAFALNWKLIDETLNGQGTSIDNYLGQQKIFDDRGVSKTITITLSGILAGAHLRGPYGVANLLLRNRGSHDEFSTSILRYIDEYGGYDTTLEDFIRYSGC